MINSNMISRQLEIFSEPVNFHTVNGNSVHRAQFCNGILPNWYDEIMNFQGAAAVTKCIDQGNMRREEKQNLELVQLVLVSERMINNGEYDEAALLVSKFKQLSSQLGNPTQRLVYYISEALQQRIHRNTLCMSNDAAKRVSDFAFNIDGELDKNEFNSLVAYYIRILPHIKLLQFTSVQAIIDTVGNPREIHVIDLGIRTGSQWTVLMEFLAQRAATSSCASRPQILKITAVGMNDEELRKSGKDFMSSLNFWIFPSCTRWW
ncbi:DELLA protein SLR1-like [Cryptomeria japonica]|uniref:DELLA protein SLR1-like n=1 Tax=Cryptomeria japonica TaxID=3369 RepID=UPI0027DA2727|nr:DELLA protein SLR1-like [Cryptomeria japonica]